jgi:hypothetical protein
MATTAIAQTAMASSSMPGPAMLTMKKLAETDWQGMRITLAAMRPQTFTIFEGLTHRTVRPTAKDNLHLMVLLADAQTSERIPYASVRAEVTEPDGHVVYDERLWPMISRSMGTHYGDNVALPRPGKYSVTLIIGPPQAARHPEYTHIWLQAKRVRVPLDWSGHL